MMPCYDAYAAYDDYAIIYRRRLMTSIGLFWRFYHYYHLLFIIYAMLTRRRQLQLKVLFTLRYLLAIAWLHIDSNTPLILIHTLTLMVIDTLH